MAISWIKGEQIVEGAMKKDREDQRDYFRQLVRYSIILVCCFAFLTLSTVPASAKVAWPQVAPSKDGTQISYEIYGSGEPTLVFVHGWSCDARYWRAQLPYFAKNHRVVLIDLAGHGHSGSTRSKYTMKAFGEDVGAVLEAAGIRRAILIGHSMGGSVIAEAARLMPNRVIGLIGVDTLQNIEYPMTREEFDKLLAPLKKDFRSGARQFVGEMILPSTDSALREWILSDMSSAPPEVALSSTNEYMSQYISGEAAKIFEEVRVPVISVSADMWPTDYEANRKHMASFDAIIIEGADHFLMMNRADEFNNALEKAINMIARKKAK
jgi:pimeloyl-ACP methyl ester carboxylesterase